MLGNHEFFFWNGFGEVCLCEKYLTGGFGKGNTAIGMLGISMEEMYT